MITRTQILRAGNSRGVDWVNRRRIKLAFTAGESIGTIAQRFRLSRTTVRKIVRSA